MNFRKLVLAATAVLLVFQLCQAQDLGPGPVAAIASVAAHTGTPLPLVPAGTVPSGQYGPHVWVARRLAAPTTPHVLQAFCKPPIGGSPLALCPNVLQTAYGVNQIVGGNGGAGITIAIVIAFHYAGAEADLNTFSGLMGLPACTSANGCFKQVSQTGGPPAAANDRSWEVELMLDLESAHAMAPQAKLLVVEGADNSRANLLEALAYAAANADIVSNSYGSIEFPGQTLVDASIPTGKPLLFSSGNTGAPPSHPCTSPKVTCVGGTTLQVNSSFQRVSETGWAGSGGGCSSFTAAQPWQAGFSRCAGRSAPDVAAHADPSFGFAVWDSGNGGFFLVGGTSLAAPLMAGIFANVMTARVSFGKSKFGFLNPTLYNAASRNYPYYHLDVVAGSNGFSAGPGYDLVTGLGVAKGPAMANRFFGLIP